MKTGFLYILSVLLANFLLVQSIRANFFDSKISIPLGLQVNAFGTPATCLNNASITATVQGNGNDIVNYQLLQGGTVIRFYQTANIFNNLPAGQNYVVQVIDITNSKTANSLPITLNTTYQNITLSANNTPVETCSGASDGVLSVTVSGGKGPYLFSLSGAKNVPAQNSNIFSGLPKGTYSITVVDNCGSSQVIESQVLSEPNPVSTLALCGGSAYIGYQVPNNCNSPLIVGLINSINNSSGSPLSIFEQSLYTWAYEYPSGSGNIYGKGGVLRAPPVPVSNLSLPLVTSASYPYTYGDIIVYDACGKSKVFKGLLYPSVPESGPGVVGAFEATIGATFDCNQGAGVTMNVPGTQAICYPIQYTFTDLVDGSQLKFTKTNYTSPIFSFYGFTPGHSYHVVSLDGNGHRANWFNTDNITMPLSAGGFGMAPVQSWNNNLGYNEANPVAVAPSAQKIGTSVYYTVTATNNIQVQIGYSDSSKFTANGNTIALNGPNPNKTWPAGTYTLRLRGSCYSSSHTFTIYGYTGKLNGLYSQTPACGSFTLGVKAILPSLNNNSVSSSYYVTILSGPSNMGKTATFNSLPESNDVYSAIFPGLAYGTYTLGLGVIGGPNNAFGQETLSYTGSNTLTIDAATTLGWICPGDSTGSLTVHAQSASSSNLYYSINNGPYQGSNIFHGLSLGTYSVKVIDACGNIASYMASVLNAANLSIRSSTLNPCSGSSLNLTANVAGALSFSWTGPNGFKSTIQSPNISITGVESSGIYSVVVITPTCTLKGNVLISVPAPPVLTINPPKPVFYPSTVDITSVIRAGNTPGLVLSYYRDSLGIQILSNPNSIPDSGTYYVKATNSQGCSVMRPVQVVIYTIPVAQIHYPLGTFCSLGSVNIIQTGTTGGYYSSGKGLQINPQTGEVNLSSSLPGIYTDTYTFSNGLHTLMTQTQLEVKALPSLSQAGQDQNLKTSTQTQTQVKATHPEFGKGVWSQVMGPNKAVIETPLQDSTLLSNLISGNYTFKWTLSNGPCDSSSSLVHIIVPYPVSLKIVSLNSVPCHGGNTGSCLVKASGGSGIYRYSVDNGKSFQASNLFTHLEAGNYQVMVQDSMDNTSYLQNITITEPEALQLITDPVNTMAPFLADITKTECISASSKGLQYSYYTDSMANQVVSNPKAIKQTGIYYIKGTNDGGCSVIAPIQVRISPIANTDSIITHTNQSVIMNPLNNDFGSLNPASLYTARPKHGFVGYNKLGVLTYTPDSNFYGLDSLEYTVCDSTKPSAQCVQAKIWIEVIGERPKTADLSLELRVPEKVNTDTYTYSIRIQNLGPDTAHFVRVSDTLAEGMVFHSSNFPNYTYDPFTRIIYWNINRLESGGGDTIIFSVSTSQLGEIMNKAGIKGEELDNNLKNNLASVTTFHSAEAFMFPTLFTPNGDGFNDQFIIKGLNDYPDNEMVVFNRFGNPVYRASGYMQDGKIWAGENLADGTYFYVLSIHFNGITHKFSGYTTLVH